MTRVGGSSAKWCASFESGDQYWQTFQKLLFHKKTITRHKLFFQMGSKTKKFVVFLQTFKLELEFHWCIPSFFDIKGFRMKMCKRN